MTSSSFQVLDPRSQAHAVQRLLSGRPDDQKLEWLVLHGKLEPVPTAVPDARLAYLFESSIGLKCRFFIVGEEFVFFGDHTTYTVRG